MRALDKLIVPVMSAAPGSPVEGQLYEDSTLHDLRVWNGSVWVDLTAFLSPAVVVANADSEDPLILRAFSATQSADLLRVEKSDGNFYLAVSGGGGVFVRRTSTGQSALIVQTQGDTNHRWRVLSSGEHEWGDGAATPDVKISRTAVDVLALAAGDGLRLIGQAGNMATPAEGQIEYDTTAHTLKVYNGTAWVPITKTFRTTHTFAVGGAIAVPSGDTDYIPGFFVGLAAGQTATVVKARYRINGGTSATIKLTKNGTDITGFTAMSATTTTTSTTPTAVAVADDDYIAVVVTAVSGAPKNLTCTVELEHTVA